MPKMPPSIKSALLALLRPYRRELTSETLEWWLEHLPRGTKCPSDAVTIAQGAVLLGVGARTLRRRVYKAGVKGYEANGQGGREVRYDLEAMRTAYFGAPAAST